MTKEKSRVEVTGEAVEAKAPAVVTYWAPENEALVVGTDPNAGIIQFSGHVLAVGARRADLIKVIESNSGFGSLFYRVDQKAGSESEQEDFQAYLTTMLEDDELDQVKGERALIALAALFTDEELVKMDTSRSNPNKTRLVRAAVASKTLKGN